MQVNCPKCNKLLNIPDELAGKLVKCPCGKQLKIQVGNALKSVQNPNPVSLKTAPKQKQQTDSQSTPFNWSSPPASSGVSDIFTNQINQHKVQRQSRIDLTKQKKKNELRQKAASVLKTTALSLGLLILVGGVAYLAYFFTARYSRSSGLASSMASSVSGNNSASDNTKMTTPQSLHQVE